MKIWPWQKLLTILEHIGQASGCGQPLLPQLLQTLVRLGSSKHIVPELVQKTHVVWQCWKLKVSRGRRWNTNTKLKCDRTLVKHTSLALSYPLSLEDLATILTPPTLLLTTQNSTPAKIAANLPKSAYTLSVINPLSLTRTPRSNKTPKPGLGCTTRSVKIRPNSKLHKKA